MTGLKGKVSVARRPHPARRLAPFAVPLVRAATVCTGLACAALAPAPALAAAATTATALTERVAVDQASGIAIFGYDPVGYFVDKRATPGREDFEFVWHGAVWRFASQANREEFRRSPETFAPAFGGYDAEAVTRGVATFADPTVFAIVDDRLFLFRSAEAMDRFLQTEGIEAADAAWPRLVQSLRP